MKVLDRERAAQLRREQSAQITQLRVEQKAAQWLSKQERANYLASRQQEVDELNKELSDEVSGLSAILSSALKKRSMFKIESLKRRPPTEAIFANRPDLSIGQKPIKEVAHISKLGFFARLIPGAKAKHAALAAEKEIHTDHIYTAKLRQYEELTQKRNEIFNAAVAEVNEFNAQMEAFADAVEKGDVEAISRYFELALQDSEYPYVFANEYRGAYDGTSKHLVVDCRLPTVADVIPRVEKYKYVKSNDEITDTTRSERASRQLYNQVVAAISLRILYEIFEYDQYRLVDVVTLNAFVETIDNSTGQPVKPYILSVRTSGDEFKRLNLQNVEPVACLKGLSAAIS